MPDAAQTLTGLGFAMLVLIGILLIVRPWR